MSIPMINARKRLAKIWFCAFGAIFLFVLAASIHEDGDRIASLWSWFLPAVVPTLSLIVGVVVAQRYGIGDQVKEVDSFLLNLATWLSVGYLALVFFSLPLDLLDLLKLSSTHLYLAPAQGLVTTALGAFFVQKDANQTEQAPQVKS